MENTTTAAPAVVQELDALSDPDFVEAALGRLNDLMGRINELRAEIPDEEQDVLDALVREINELRAEIREGRLTADLSGEAIAKVAEGLSTDFKAAAAEARRRAAVVGAQVVALGEQYLALRDWLSQLIKMHRYENAGTSSSTLRQHPISGCSFRSSAAWRLFSAWRCLKVVGGARTSPGSATTSPWPN